MQATPPPLLDEGGAETSTINPSLSNVDAQNVQSRGKKTRYVKFMLPTLHIIDTAVTLQSFFSERFDENKA
jgi:hypothetical protein